MSNNDISQTYTALGASSPRLEVSNVLQSIIDAPPFSFNQSSRQELIQVLLNDLKASTNQGAKSRLTPKEAAQALLAVKTLGKQPAGSQYISAASNLSILLALSTAFKDDPDASLEALRCVANALLLIEGARTTWVGKDVKGGGACVELLEKSASPDQIFVASRILFLCTCSAGSSGGFIRSLVEDKHHGGSIVDIIGAKLDTLTISILSGAKMSKEAMTDLLKFTFNLLLHYPKMVESEPQAPSGKGKGKDIQVVTDDAKVMGDFWSSKLDGILPPLLRVFASLPPTFPNPLAPPLTHVIHSLITIPIQPSLRSAWLGPRSGRSTNSNSPVNSAKPQPTGSNSTSRSDSPSSTSPRDPNKPGAIDRALSVLAAGRRSLSRSPSPMPSSSPDVLQRAYDLLDVSLNHFLPEAVEADDASVRERCTKEGDNSLDDLMTPLVVLITRLTIADDASRARAREWIVPADLDRSRALETRPDLLGRCLRLLQSVYHTRLKDAIGEMLYAICDSDAHTLSSLFGYGNVAGFLFHKGIMSAPPASNPSGAAPPTTFDGRPIDPITGTIVEKPEPVDMTDEEKEREAEKLFTLFDRLEKSGAMPASQNPIRKAVAEGKLEF